MVQGLGEAARLWYALIVDGGTKLFWGLTLALFFSSAFFGVNAEQQRRQLHRAHAESELNDGDEVSLGQVIDGDSLVVVNSDGNRVAVRLVGIKAFDASSTPSNSGGRIGAAAISALRQWFESETASVQLNPTPKDAHGRYLVHLFLKERDLGLRLVREGLALVYTAYSFDEMQDYLTAQAAARAERTGLWRDPLLTKKADGLLLQWREQSK